MNDKHLEQFPEKTIVPLVSSVICYLIKPLQLNSTGVYIKELS